MLRMPRSGGCLFLLVGLTPAMAGPVARVLEFADPRTQSAEAAKLLAAAGCTVETLPLDRSPAELDADLIFIGALAAEQPGCADYLRAHAAGLAEFVARGHLLVQMTQPDQVEASPPFLPSGLEARRGDEDFAEVHVLSAEHPLARDLPAERGRLRFSRRRTAWETFVHQRGFEVILAADPYAQKPVLMEAAWGRGRIVLAALALDKANLGYGPEDVDAVALAAVRAAFFRNLAEYAAGVRARTAPEPRVTPPPLTVAEYVPGSWTLAVLPDTQMYALRYPGLLLAQTGWLRQNRVRLNIQYVFTLGDLTNNNTPEQWARVRAAFNLLEGELPYALVLGNHDYGPNGDTSSRDTRLNEYFPFAGIAQWPTFGGARDRGRLENTFHLFEAGGRKWIVLALEWAPRDETVAWADAVLTQHADRRGIVLTHGYLDERDHRLGDPDVPLHPHHPSRYRASGSDGEQLWHKLVRRQNVLLVLNGHLVGDGAAYLASRNDRGAVVHQMLANYQMRELGGEAYLRLLEFQPDGRTVQVKTYSPLYDRWLLQPDQQFMITLDPP